MDRVTGQRGIFASIALSLTVCVPSGGSADTLCPPEPLPEIACLTAPRTSVIFRTKHPPGGKDRTLFRWRWASGEALEFFDLGTPSVDTNYSLCAWDTTPVDTTFGIDGIATAPPAGPHDNSADAMAMQTDGKIVVVGRSESENTIGHDDLTVVRFHADGSLDTSFGGDGVVTSVIKNYSQGFSVALQSDGKIVVAGRAWEGAAFNSVVVLVRYNADGSLDGSFGSGGIVTLGSGDEPAEAWAVAIQGDEKVVAVGYWDGARRIARFNTDGSPDTSFDGDGNALIDLYDMSFKSGVAVQSDGKILVVGNEWVAPSDWASAVVRYNADGSLDTTFDDDGKAVINVGSMFELATDVVVQANGKVVVVGALWGAEDRTIVLLRYTSDGSLDASFGDDGVVTTVPQNPTVWIGSVIEVAIHSGDGKIVVSGESGDYLLRYHGDGTLDTGFDGDGLVVIPPGQYGGGGNGFAVLNDGRIVVAGSRYVGHQELLVTRYNANAAKVRTLVTSLDISTGGLWEPRASRAWRYLAKAIGSTEKVQLESGAVGKSSGEVKFRGPQAPRPYARASDRRFDQDPSLIMQTLNSEGLCLTSEFTVGDTSKSDLQLFKAKTY